MYRITPLATTFTVFIAYSLQSKPTIFTTFQLPAWPDFEEFKNRSGWFKPTVAHVSIHPAMLTPMPPWPKLMHILGGFLHKIPIYVIFVTCIGIAEEIRLQRG